MALHNKLKNGGFTVIPFEYVPYKFKTIKLTQPDTEPTPYGNKPVRRLTWFKDRRTTGVTLSDVVDRTVVPGWSVTCSKKDGATIEYNPIDPNTGYRIWSRDGGQVLAIKFNTECTVTISQIIDYFNEFYLQEYTVGLGGYTMMGSPFVNARVDAGVRVDGILTAFGNSFGDYRRVCKTSTFPGDSTKMVLSVEINGKSKEEIGISGIMLCLGRYSIECPFADNPVYYELPAGTVLFSQTADVFEGYEDVGDDCLFYQTYGDALSIDNSPPVSIQNPELEYTPQMRLGNDNHNAHFSHDPFSEGELEWLSDVAWGAIRIKSPDFNDRGLKNPAPVGPSDYYLRLPDIYWLIKKWATGDTIRFAGWNRFDMDALNLEDGNEFPADTEITLNEFARTTRMAIFLPGSPGLYKSSSTDVYSKYMDLIEQEHRHLFRANKDEKTLPPYKVFKACRKI